MVHYSIGDLQSQKQDVKNPENQSQKLGAKNRQRKKGQRYYGTTEGGKTTERMFG
jgi:hypothetical protein